MFLGTKGQHTFCCGSGGHRQHKHNELNRIQQRMAQAAGIKCDYEPPDAFPHLDSGDRPDLRFSQPRFTKNELRDVVSDTCVTHPSNKSALLLGSHRKQGISALNRQNFKTNRYKTAATQHNILVVGISIETYGTFSPSLRKIMAILAKRICASNQHSLPYGCIIELWRQRMSIALQKFNAIQLLQHTKAAVLQSRSILDDVENEQEYIALH